MSMMKYDCCVTFLPEDGATQPFDEVFSLLHWKWKWKKRAKRCKGQNVVFFFRDIICKYFFAKIRKYVDRYLEIKSVRKCLNRVHV